MASKNLAENPYEKLANAIILQAVSDYRVALKKVKKNPKNRDAIDGANCVFEGTGNQGK